MAITTNSSTVPDIELRDVHKHFGDFHAVRGINLVIEQGEFFSLLGPSGCGKTTTLRMLGGFVFPSSGEIYIKGEPMGQKPPFLRPTNMVFQQLALFPHMSVFENIAYSLKLRRVPRDEIRKRVEEALALVRLQGYGSRRIQQLSGGQQQRVAIARALVARPQVLLLDEPLGALDLQLRLELQSELKRIQRELGTTFVFVTHDQGEAMLLSDRIGIMHEGHLVQVGTAEEIYQQPASVFVAKFIGETNLLPGVVESTSANICRVKLSPQVSILGANGNACQAGDSVQVSVRHERVQVGETLGGLDNRFRAIVRDVVFLGSSLVYELQLDDGLVLHSQVPAGEGVTRYSVGTSVEVGWNAVSSTVLAS